VQKIYIVYIYIHVYMIYIRTYAYIYSSLGESRAVSHYGKRIGGSEGEGACNIYKHIYIHIYMYIEYTYIRMYVYIYSSLGVGRTAAL